MRRCQQCSEPADITALCPTCDTALCEFCGIGDDRICLRCHDVAQRRARRELALYLSGATVRGERLPRMQRLPGLEEV